MKKVLAIFFAVLFCLSTVVVVGATDDADVQEAVAVEEVQEVVDTVDVCCKCNHTPCCCYKNPVVVAVKTAFNTVIQTIDDCIFNVMRFMHIYLCLHFITPCRPISELFDCICK